MNVQDSGNSLRSLLVEIQTKYDDINVSTSMQCVYSKAALMELSGWIEETNDYLIISYSEGKLEANLQKNLLKKIKDIYGFKYTNFEHLFILAIGYVNYQKIINQPEISTDLIRFKNLLKKLIDLRNSAAHTHAKLPLNLNAPNSHFADLTFLVKMFIDFENSLINLK